MLNAKIGLRISQETGYGSRSSDAERLLAWLES
jgi:hypothetical protein